MHLQYVANVKNNSYWQEITKQFTVEKLRSTKVIAFREIKCGKYFRILANVFVGSKNLGEVLINAGHARFYNGGKRGLWCN